MIDYEKLILAHRLCEGFQYDCDFSVWHSKKEPRLFVIKFYDSDDMFHEYESENIDEIIEILRKFTQDKPKPKYELGQVVYFIDLPVNKIHQGYVKRVRDDEYIVVTDKPGPKEDYSESELYPSKQALIESQIEYWTSLRNEEILTKNEELREE